MFDKIGSVLSGLLRPASDAYKARTERKQAAEAAQAKLLMAKQQGQHKLELTDAEWEVVGQQLQGGTWKDEYVTVSFVSIINATILGAVLSAFGYPGLLEGLILGVSSLKNEMGIRVGLIMEAVVLAAIGLKVWRSV